MSTSLHLPPGPPVEPAPPDRRRRRVAVVLTTAVVVAGAGVLIGLVAAPERQPAGKDLSAAPSAAATGPGASEPTAAGQAAAGQAAAGQAAAAPGAPAPGAGPSAAGDATAAPAQWLWPFATAADVTAWQQASRDRGVQPWHLDPAATAVGFAAHLGYANIDRALRSTVDGNDAYVAVGYRLPDGTPHSAAEVHLVKVGTGADAPWEVAGTRDSTLTLTRPAYGATVTSPLTAGGRITGADERVVVTLHTRTATLPASAAVAAGGQRTPWSVPVTFQAPTGTLLTVAAATGGHSAAVERFAVTAVRVGSRPATDVDGDGRPDTVSIPAPGTLQVHYGTGRTERVRFEAAPGDGRLQGVVDADRDGRDEVFVHVARGAATEQTSMFRYVDGKLRPVTLDGHALVLVSGASVRNASTWGCRPPSAPIVQWLASSSDGVTYSGPLRSYRFAGATLVLTSSRPLTTGDPTTPPTGCAGMTTG